MQEKLFNQFKNFIYEYGRKPTLILMHPKDYYSFVRIISEQHYFFQDVNKITFNGIVIKRSYDTEETKIEMY